MEEVGSHFKKRSPNQKEVILGGGFKYLLFSPLLGEMIQFDYVIFFKGFIETTN